MTSKLKPALDILNEKLAATGGTVSITKTETGFVVSFTPREKKCPPPKTQFNSTTY